MKFKDKYDIAPGFEDLFSFSSKEEEIEHEATMIMFRFLSELEKIAGDKPLKKKEIATAIGTSPSFVTQLFQGDKLLNLVTIAKIQEAFNITFEITAKDNSESYKEEVTRVYQQINKKNESTGVRNAGLYKNIPTFIRDGVWMKQHLHGSQTRNVKTVNKNHNNNIAIG